MKKVRFDEKCILHEINRHAHSELASRKIVKRRWYTQEDYDEFALDRSYCTFKLRHTGKDTLLDNVIPCGDGALVDSMTLRSKLFEWTEIGICRGLEMKINRSHRYQRSEERRKAIYAVLKLQDRLRVKTDCKNYCEIIRASYEKYSEGAKIFAREMAHVNEKCIELELKAPVMIKQTSILQRLLRR
jgi:hypothetical protein